MTQNIVDILNFKVSNKLPLFLIAGPCSIESKEHAINHAGMIKDICDKLNGLGGLQTLEDFSNYTANWVKPINYNYRGYSIHECPPNGQGITAILMTKMLDKLNIKFL